MMLSQVYPGQEMLRLPLQWSIWQRVDFLTELFPIDLPA